jgi:putative hydrolase of the HAD superfamily
VGGKTTARAGRGIARRRATRERIRCQAVFLDAGGVIVLPRARLVVRTLTQLEIACDERGVGAAHYEAVRFLDRSPGSYQTDGYIPAFCQALGVSPARLEEAIGALSHLADRERSGEILWSDPVPGARQTIDALGRAGISVVVVTNSDGHAEENLRDAGICQTTAGSGAIIASVIDSRRIGSAKPDPAIFHAALRRAGARPEETVHVGDMMTTDIAGARAAGIVPIHLDPYGRCRAADHRHIRAPSGIWRHVTAVG